MTTQGQLDTLEDAVEAKANREYVMVRRETAQNVMVIADAAKEKVEEEISGLSFLDAVKARRKYKAVLEMIGSTRAELTRALETK